MIYPANEKQAEATLGIFLSQKQLLELLDLEELLWIFRAELFGVGDFAGDRLITWKRKDNGQNDQKNGKELEREGEKLIK